MVIRRGPIARQDGNANTRRSVQPSRKSKNNRVQTREGSIAVSDAQSALLTAFVASSNNAHIVKNDMETMSVYSRRSTNTIKNVNYNSSSSIREEWLRNFKPFPIPSLQYIAHSHEIDECAKRNNNLNRIGVQHVDDGNNNQNNINNKNNQIVRTTNHHAVMKSSETTTSNSVDVEVSKFNENEFEIANTHQMHFDRAVMFVNLNYVCNANEQLRDEKESNEKMECWHTLRSAHEARTSSDYSNWKLQWEENISVYKQEIITQNFRLLPNQELSVLYYEAELYIAEQLNRQYRNIGFDGTEFSSHVNNTANNVNQFLEEFIREVVDHQNIEAIHERQSAHSDKHHSKCILLHYNGHGVENVTRYGDIWFANLDTNTHDNFRILNVLYHLPCSAVVVMDCNKAGYILRCWLESDLRKKRPDDFFFICACRRDEELPRHPALPADVLTSSLTTPLRMALEFYIHFAPQHTLMPNDKSAKIHVIPGSLNDITTPRGELNFILSTITFTIAWSTFDPHSFTRVFCTNSKELKALFCNALLADRILRSVHVTPQTFPALPNTAHIHFLWNLWDYTLSKAIQLLVRGMPDCTNGKELNNHCNNHIDEKRMKCGASSESSAHYSQTIPEVRSSITTEGRFTTFFKDQLTAFELWVNAGDWTEPPCELPSVLNAIYYAEYRTRATTLLLKYFDICPSAVGDSLLCGLLPIMQMLMKSTPELLLAVMMMWAKVIQVCPSTACAAAFEQTNYFYEYFMYILELKANACDWIEIKCGEVAPVHEDKLDGVDMEVEIKRYIAAKKHKLKKTKPAMPTTVTTLERNQTTRAHDQHSLPSERLSKELEQEKEKDQQQEEGEQLQQQEEITKEEELQDHRVHEQRCMRFYLLSGVSLERCKCIACYVLCELLEWAKEEEKHIQLWNSSLLNITLPLLSSTSATSLSTSDSALLSDATRAELRSWACLLLSQLALHLPHAKEILSRECTLHLEVFTTLLLDDSPLVRSSCVTLLANIMGTRIDRLSHEDQLKRLRMEILMLSRLRACLPDASMAVRSEVIYFACQVLYHYYPIIVQVNTEKQEHAEHLEVAEEESHYEHEEQQQQQYNNNNNILIRELEQEVSDIANNEENTHENGESIQAGEININTPTNYIRNVLHNLTNLTLDKIEWMNVERDISVHSKLSENRPTLNVAFDDTILFEMTHITSSSPLLSHSFDVNKPTDKSITLVRCLLHDAETMLYYLYANCDAERVRCALYSMLVEDKNNDTINTTYINTMSRQKGNSAHDEKLKRRYVSRNQELASSAFSNFSSSLSSSLSSSSLPPLHRPRSYRFMLYAKNTMSRVWTDVNATLDYISESCRTRERWNDDTMKQLVLDFQDRKRQFRPATSNIRMHKSNNIINNNISKNDDVNDNTSVHKEYKQTDNIDECQDSKHHDKALPENTNDFHDANQDNNGGDGGDKDEHHEQKNREYVDIDSNNAKIELSLIQAPCHQILHSSLNPSSLVCSAFRALEPSVMMVSKNQTFMYMSYSDFHSLKLQNKFKLNAESAPIRSICVINDLSEEAGLLVVNKYGGMKLVKNCFTLSSHTMDETENNYNNNIYGNSSKNTIEPEIVATFAACPPFSAESMMRSMSARGAELTQRAEALKERRVINLKLLYHSHLASLIYGGSIGDNNETEVHVLSLHHEQVAQKLRLGESTQLTSLASHPTQQALIAGCKDGSLHFFDKRQRERGQFGLLKSFKHNPAQVPVITTTATAQRDEQIINDVAIVDRRTNTRLNSLIHNGVNSTNKQNTSGTATSHLTGPNANINRYNINNNSNNIIKGEVESTFAQVSNAVLGVGIFTRNGYYTFITASPSSVNVFDSRKTNEPIAMHSAHDLYHLYEPHDYDQLFELCETHSRHPEQCYSHRTAPLITSCTISPFTELIGLTFSDNSYGLFNDKMELLHDKLVIAEALRDTHATPESSSNLFLSPYSIFNSAFAHSHLPSSISSPSSLSMESSMLPSKSSLKPILASSANIHPLRSMMTFGGSVLSYHQL